MNSGREKMLATGGLVFAVVLILFGIFAGGAPRGEKFNDFALCLSEKGVTMYGADWCSHCQDQKNMFGDSFQFVSYVECPDEPEVCTGAGIEGYPTWKFPDGRTFEGVQSLKKLSEESGCALP